MGSPDVGSRNISFGDPRLRLKSYICLNSDSQDEFIPLWQELQPGRKAILIERLLRWEGLTEFEVNFCSQMQLRTGRYSRPPTPKQLDVLNQIVTKAWREGVCA